MLLLLAVVESEEKRISEATASVLEDFASSLSLSTRDTPNSGIPVKATSDLTNSGLVRYTDMQTTETLSETPPMGISTIEKLSDRGLTNVILETSEDVPSQAKNAYQWRTSSVTIEASSPTVHLNAKDTDNINPEPIMEPGQIPTVTPRLDGLPKISDIARSVTDFPTSLDAVYSTAMKPATVSASSEQNAQQSKRQWQRDQIPVITPKLEGFFSLSDALPKKTHSSASFGHTDNRSENVESGRPSLIKEESSVSVVTSSQDTLASSRDVSSKVMSSSSAFATTAYLRVGHPTIVTSSELSANEQMQEEREELYSITSAVGEIASSSDITSSDKQSSLSFVDASVTPVMNYTNSTIIPFTKQNAQSNSPSSIQIEGDQIPSLTPRPQGLHSVSDISLKEIHFSTFYHDTESPIFMHLTAATSSGQNTLLSDPFRTQVELDGGVVKTTNLDGLTTLSFVSLKGVQRLIHVTNSDVVHPFSEQKSQLSSPSDKQVRFQESPTMTPRLEKLASLINFSPTQTHFSTVAVDLSGSVHATLKPSYMPSKIQQERDEIPMVTSRIVELVSLSGVSTSVPHSTNPFVHTNKPDAEQEYNNVQLVGAKSLPNPTPTHSNIPIQSFDFPFTASKINISVHESKRSFLVMNVKDTVRSIDKEEPSPATKQAPTFKQNELLKTPTTDTPRLPVLSSFPTSSSPQVSATSMVERATILSLTPLNRNSSSLEPTSTHQYLSLALKATRVEPASTSTSHHTTADSLLSSRKWKTEPTPNLLVNQTIMITKSYQPRKTSSLYISHGHGTRTPVILTVSKQLQLSVSSVILTSKPLNSIESKDFIIKLAGNATLVELAQQHRVDLTPSANVPDSMAASQKVKNNLTESSKQGTSVSRIWQTELIPISSTGSGNTSAPSGRQLSIAKTQSIAVSLSAVTLDPSDSLHSSDAVNVSVNASYGTPVKSLAFKKEITSASSVRGGLDAFQHSTAGTFITDSVDITSKPLQRTLEETLGKVKEKQKVVRALASGIVSSPVFHLALRHIGELLKNETGLVHSVARLESMLGHLQRLVLRETNNHLRTSANLSLPFNETMDRGDGSSEISKHVDLKLEGISSKLKRISSVLAALQLKRRDPNSTVIERSKIERPEKLTRVDNKHNKLIELLLKRFTKLEAMIQTKRNYVKGNSFTTIVSRNGNVSTHFQAISATSTKVSAFLEVSKTTATRPHLISPTSSHLSREMMTLQSHGRLSAATTRKIETGFVQLSTLRTVLPSANSRVIPFFTASKLNSHLSVVETRHSFHHEPVRNKTLSSHAERSKEFTYVTFRGGLEAGVFTERGKVETMETCVELCYDLLSCHVAFMVGNTCYSIQCYSQKTCEVLPVDTTVINTRVVYLKDRMLRLPYSTTSHPTASSLVYDSNFTIKNCAKNITVLKNMTFLAGMSAGNYTDYGTVDSIQACSNICCSKKVCDAAFMILNNCFTIDCVSDKACHAIPSKSQKVNTSIVYFRKTLSKKHSQPEPKGIAKIKAQQTCPLVSGVLKGVTLKGGINAGNFTDHGIVNEFSSCVDKCCNSQNCDVAFMVENNCYSVKCAEDKSGCLPLNARTTKLKTFMALKNNSFFENVPFPATGHISCIQSGGIQRGYTFQRGLKAGNFTLRSEVKNVSACIKECCSSSCNAAFMIGENCYSVACANKRDCKTMKAKQVDFTTAIAFVARAQNRSISPTSGDIGSDSMTQFTKSILGGHCDITDEQTNVNITGGWKSGKFLRLPDIKDMKKCTEACCDYHGCGAAMFIDQYCYNLICFKTRGCKFTGSKKAFMINKFVGVRKNLGHLLSPFKKAQIRLLTESKEHVSHSTFMRDVRNAIKGQNQSTILNVKNSTSESNSHVMALDYTGSHYIHPTRTNFNTNSKNIVYNLNVKKHDIPSRVSSQHGGLITSFSLSRTVSSKASSMSNVISSLSSGASRISSTTVRSQVDTANMGKNVWHAISVTPMLQLLPGKRISSKPFSSSRKSEVTRQSLSYVKPWDTFRNQVGSSMFSMASFGGDKNKNSSSIFSSEDYSFMSDYSLLKERKNRNRKRSYACTHTFVFNNSTLRGGLEAGDVKNEGKVEGVEECVEMCCKTPECNVAFLVNETCYIVACFNKRGCEAIPAKGREVRESMKVAYVARSKDETELIKQLISHTETSKINANRTGNNKPKDEKHLPMTDVVVKQGSCIRSPVLRDVRFKLGKHAGDFKSVGIVTGIDECVVLCCETTVCNAVFMLGSRCHLVSCSNELDCQTVAAKSEFYKPTVVYLARNKVEVEYFLKMIPKELLDKYQNNDNLNVTSDEDGAAIRRSQLERAKGKGNNGNITRTHTEVSQKSLHLVSLNLHLTSSGIVNASSSTTPTLESTNTFSIQHEISPSVHGVIVKDKTNTLSESSYIFPVRPGLNPSLSNTNNKEASHKLKSSSVLRTSQEMTSNAGTSYVVTTSNPVLESSNVFPPLKQPTPVLGSVTPKKTLEPSYLIPTMERESKSLSNINGSTFIIQTQGLSNVSSSLATSHLNTSNRTLKTWNPSEITNVEDGLKNKTPTTHSNLAMVVIDSKTSSIIPRQLSDIAETAATAPMNSLLVKSMISFAESLNGSSPRISVSPPTSGYSTVVEKERREHQTTNTIQIESDGASSTHSPLSLNSMTRAYNLANKYSDGNVPLPLNTPIKVKPSSSLKASNMTVSHSAISKITSTPLLRPTAMPYLQTEDMKKLSSANLSNKESSHAISKNLVLTESVLTLEKTTHIKVQGGDPFKENKRGDIPLKSSVFDESTWTALNITVGSYLKNYNSLTRKALNPSSAPPLRSLLSTSLHYSSGENTTVQLSKVRDNPGSKNVAVAKVLYNGSPSTWPLANSSGGMSESDSVDRMFFPTFSITSGKSINIITSTLDESVHKISFSGNATPEVLVAHYTLTMSRTTRVLLAVSTVQGLKTTSTSPLAGFPSEPLPLPTHFLTSSSNALPTRTAHSLFSLRASPSSFNDANNIIVTPTRIITQPTKTKSIQKQLPSSKNTNSVSYMLEMLTFSKIMNSPPRYYTRSNEKSTPSLMASPSLLSSQVTPVSPPCSQRKTESSVSFTKSNAILNFESLLQFPVSSNGTHKDSKLNSIEQELSLLQWKQNQTSSSLRKAEDLLQSLQGSLSNMEMTTQEIATSRKLVDSGKQNISRKQNDSLNTEENLHVNRIMKELSDNFPKIPLIQTLNHSIQKLISNVSRSTANYMKVNELLSDIRRILLRKETSTNVDAISSSGTSIFRTPKSTLHYTTASTAYPPSVTKKDLTSKEIVVGHLSMASEKHKRVEIPEFKPFAGGFLEEIKELQPLKRMPQYLSHDTISDSTPISGALLEQIRPLHEMSPRLPSIGNSKRISSASTDSSLAKVSVGARRAVLNDKVKSGKAATTGNLQTTDSFTLLASADNQRMPQLTPKYLSPTTTTTLGRSRRHQSLSIRNDGLRASPSRTSHNIQFQALLPYAGLDGHPSPLPRPETMRVNNPTPSDVVKLSSTIHSKISTPPLSRTRVPSMASVKHFDSHSMWKESAPVTRDSSQTIKLSRQYTAKELQTSSAEMAANGEKSGMFGYFAQLLKSIKDILTQKNRNPHDDGVRAPSSVFHNLSSATERSFESSSLFLSVLNTPLRITIIPGETVKPSVTTLTSAFVTATKFSSKLIASKGLDMSLAMQPLRELSLNITGIHKAALCKHSPVHVNSTLRGGVHAGVLRDFGTVSNDAECISQCCLSKTCDAAFLLLNRCFLVTCKSRTLCDSVPAKTLTFRPRVIYMQKKVPLPTEGKSQTVTRPFDSSFKQNKLFPSTRSGMFTMGLFPRDPGDNSATKKTPKPENVKDKFLCKASITRQNVTLRGGINSGHFKDEGTVKSMERCIELCCGRANCSVAFMLLNRCFSVICYNKTSCKSIPARSLIFQPQLAYVGRNLSSPIISVTHIDTIAKTQGSTPLFSASTELITESKTSMARLHDNCRHGNLEKEVTLRGGVNAGSFLDAGLVSNIEQCADHCCSVIKCDVAFMIMKRCFLVTCFSSRLCESIPARNADYFTELVHVSRDETAVVRDLLARLVQPSSPKFKIESDFESLATTVGHLSSRTLALFSQLSFIQETITDNKHLTLTRHFIGPRMNLRSPTVPPAVPVPGALIKSTIEPVKENKQELVGLIQTIGMSTRPESTRHLLDKTITPSSLIGNSPLSSLEWAKRTRNVTFLGKELETSGAFSEDEICQSTVVYYNATMRGGINTGVFKDQGTVQNMRKCIEHCCRWQFCSLAFMLLTRCYTIACYNEHLCDPVPAKNLTFTPRIAFISRVRRDQDNFTNILENSAKPSPSGSSAERTRLNTSITGKKLSFLQATDSYLPSIVTTRTVSLPNSLEIKPSPSQWLFSKVFTLPLESRHNCTSSEQKHNVTLRGGLNAGHFKDNGKVVNIQQCIDLCCGENHCDLALMLLENCFTVRCHNKQLCESVPAKTSKYRSKIVYVNKISSVNSTRLFTHKSTKTISLLDAALPAMGEGDESNTSQTENKSTVADVIGRFDSEQLADLLSPSPATANRQVMLNSSILKLGVWSSAVLSLNQSKILKLQQIRNQTVGASFSHHHHYATPSILASSIHKSSLMPSPMFSLNTNSSAHTEHNKSTTKGGVLSGFSSGLTRTLEDLPRHSINQPFSCLDSPISYNVTLRNGIRSGYFRDQGRVENMGECIRKCCDSDRCDVAFMLKERCYLVTCYTKKGCQTVQARNSMFRPRVAHVRRTNVSQLMSFMDEQETVEHPQSVVKADHITPSSTLPALVKSFDNSSRHSIKTKKLLDRKNNATQSHHNNKRHYKMKSKKGKNKPGNQATHHKIKHVTVAPELKKKKARKPIKKHHGNIKVTDLKHTRTASSKAAKIQRFKSKLDKKRNRKLSHSDLEQLFRLMKPKKALVRPEATGMKNTSTEAHTLAPKLDGKSSTPTPTTAVNQQNQPTAPRKKNTGTHKSQNTTNSKNSFASKVERLFNDDGDKSRLTLSHNAESVNSESLKRNEKPTRRQRMTHATSSGPLATRKPKPHHVKSPLRHHNKLLSTKSTVPLLPTQAPVQEDSSCKTDQVEYNQTLRGGLSSGLFHEVGKVNDMKSCSQHCCSSPICDLAFMVLHHCFLVTCSSSNPRMCDSTPALATNFNPMISRVTRNLGEDKVKETAAKPNIKPSPTMKPMAPPPKLSPQQPELLAPEVANNKTSLLFSSFVSPSHESTIPSHTITMKRPAPNRDSSLLQMAETPISPQKIHSGCISSVTEHNVTLRGGLHAGKFTDAGKVNGSSICTELCCKANDCDVAFYAFNRCFLVKCFDEYLCGSTPSMLPNFNPTVIHVYRHHSKPTTKPATTLPPINAVLEAIEDETQTKMKSTKTKNKTCAHSDEYKEVTLRMGYHAGNFTSRGKVNSTKQCVDFCCQQLGCDLIFMFLNNCYTVMCSSGYACEIVPARKSRFDPKVVYFIKNNSSPVIKPSDFNSTLSGFYSVDKQPVNVVHYKEVRANKTNRNSYKKDFAELKNITQTIDEEFVVIPDNKLTARNVIKSTANATLEDQKHSVGNYSSNKTVLRTTDAHLKSKQHKLILKGNATKKHTVNPTDEKMDIVIKKLFNITEENKYLEGEIRSLKATKDKPGRTKKKSPSGSAAGDVQKSKRKPPLRKIKRKRISNKIKERKSRLGYNDAGSAIDSNASKRVVLVDTDRPPWHPPTDEHNIQEHSIQRFHGKIHEKAHHVNSTRKALPKKKRLREQHTFSKKNHSNHWRPTDEHAIEERVIYTAGSASGHPKESGKHKKVGVDEGFENKYGQPEPDKDSLELGEIMNLKLTNKTGKKPEEPVWVNSGNKNKDDMAIPHESERKDTFQFDKQSVSGNKNVDDMKSFHEQMSPTPKPDFLLETRKERKKKKFKHGDEIDFENQIDGDLPEGKLWVSSSSENKDQMKNFHEQMSPTPKPDILLETRRERKKKKLKHADEIDFENQIDADLPEGKLWVSSSSENKDQMKNFHEQMSPTPKPDFLLETQKERKEKKFKHGDEINFENQTDADLPEGKLWVSSSSENKDQMKNFHEQIAPTAKVHFEFYKQRESKDVNEDEFQKEQQHERPFDELSGRKGDIVQNTAIKHTKEPEPRFTTSKSEPTLSEFAQMDTKFEKSHPEQSTIKNDYTHRHKLVPSGHSLESTRSNDIKESEQIAVVKTSEDIYPSSGYHHESITSLRGEDRKSRHKKPDLDAIFDRINTIYNRLQDLIEQHSQRSNATAGKNAVTNYSRRNEERIPKPPMSSRMSTPAMSISKPSPTISFGKPSHKTITVVKQYVTDKVEGSGEPASRNLMDYIKTIYSRVQELYKRGTKQASVKGKNSYRKKKGQRTFASGDWKKGRKFDRKRTRSRIEKKHQRRKKKEEESVLREMKQIYKKMKKMYRQQSNSQKKSEVTSREAERQRQRSFIPTSSSKISKPISLGSSVGNTRPLNSSIGDAQRKPQVHITGMYPSSFV